MTRALEKAFAEASRLPDDEQDSLARWLLAEMADERGWDAKFSSSQDALSQLADEALEAISSGKVTDLDVTKL